MNSDEMSPDGWLVLRPMWLRMLSDEDKVDTAIGSNKACSGGWMLKNWVR